jgi:hypothetical protein
VGASRHRNSQLTIVEHVTDTLFVRLLGGVFAAATGGPGTMVLDDPPSGH